MYGCRIRHPDRTELFFRFQIQGNRKLIHCFRIFYPARACASRGYVIRSGVHTICLRTKKIFESYFSDRLTFSNSRGRTSLRLEKWFPLKGERAHCLKSFCMHDKRFDFSKTK